MVLSDTSYNQSVLVVLDVLLGFTIAANATLTIKVALGASNISSACLPTVGTHVCLYLQFPLYDALKVTTSVSSIGV